MAAGRPQNNGILPNGAPQLNPVPGAIPLLPNQGRIVQTGSQRILCVADVRGNLSSLNDLATQARADYVLHTGDFGFYDQLSLDRIAEKTLKHVAQYSPLITEDVRRQITNPPHGGGGGSVKDRIPRASLPLSQLPQFLSGALSFKVPVYTVWGACEDVQVLEKLRSGEYKINNLHIIDESHSRLLEIGGIKLRLLGLGGALVMHKLFDNGEGRTTIAGGQGTMWTTLLQMGELVDTANRVYDPTETRVLVTHASPAREGLLNQLSVALKVDFSISAGLHFRYGSSYNEFSVNPTLDHYRGKLAASKASFNDVWETVKAEVQPAVQENEAQKRLLDNALEIVGRMPSVANGGNPFGGHVGPNSGQVDEAAFKNMWNFNLADAAFGWLVLEIENGRIGTEMRAQGFNFAHRGQKNPVLQADMVKPSGPSANAVPAQQAAAAQGAQVPRGAVPAAVTAPVAGTGQAAPTQPGRQVSGVRPGQPVPGAVQQQQAPQQTAKSPAAGGRPVASPSNPKGLGGPAAPTANGSANGTPAPADEGTKDSPVAEKKPSQAIFVQNASTEEETRNLFQEEDRNKIQRIERSGRAFVVHFNSPEEMQKVLGDVSSEFKKGGHGKPNVREYQERARSNWNATGRGGQQGGGYRSGGASDSEGGRGGRGSFRGPRGGRGGERGRGGRGGRGAFRGDVGGGSPAASPAPPAAS